jgi:phosphoribosylaminoimidazole-succinocarboxamide synthase
MSISQKENCVTPSATQSVLRESSLPTVKLFSRGKVRDVYQAGPERLLVVATDRLSAFDVVMEQGIPDKGRVLTQLSCFWFDLMKDSVKSHFLSASLADFPPEFAPYADQLSGRSMLVLKAKPFPIECIVRGYLSGSGWKDYRATGSVCGIKLPGGLQESSKIDPPIFTPSTKAETGHDENITWEQMVAAIGAGPAEELRRRSLDVYQRARDYADGRGIIIADTKFEWGLHAGEIILIDEVLTPDSSRFWPRDGYQPGRSQPSYDKQFVRDYLESTGWKKQPPPPPLPDEVVRKTSEKYREAYLRLTGKPLD